MGNIIQMHQTTSEALIAELKQSFREEINQLKEDLQTKPPEELLTRNEVSQLLKVDLSTIHHWTKAGKLKRYGIGKRVYYKRSEIEEALVEIRTSKRL